MHGGRGGQAVHKPQNLKGSNCLVLWHQHHPPPLPQVHLRTISPT